jgi:nucleotide-binding universal stress UspA family protein
MNVQGDPDMEITKSSSCGLPVVVGIDGSDTSINAACWAAILAQKLKVRLHLVHSAVTTGHYLGDAAIIAIKAAAPSDQYDVAARVLAFTEQTVHALVPDLQVSSEITPETATDTLLCLSREAQFLVVGCADINRPAALLLGSTSLTLATRATSPVIAWRGIAAPTDAPVLVGVDDTPAGAAALTTAFNLAEAFNISVKALHCWSPSMGVDRMTFPYLIDWDAVAGDELARLIETVRPWADRYPDVKVKYLAESGKPSRILLQQSADAQMVIVGNHRRSALSSATLGSTTLNMLHHSTIPVIVCHNPEAAP